MWYTYRQNNSRGMWQIDQPLLLLIEAPSPYLANKVAEKYVDFDQPFCKCCGARWRRASHKWEGHQTFDLSHYNPTDSNRTEGAPIVVVFEDGLVWYLESEDCPEWAP